MLAVCSLFLLLRCDQIEGCQWPPHYLLYYEEHSRSAPPLHCQVPNKDRAEALASALSLSRILPHPYPIPHFVGIEDSLGTEPQYEAPLTRTSTTI